MRRTLAGIALIGVLVSTVGLYGPRMVADAEHPQPSTAHNTARVVLRAVLEDVEEDLDQVDELDLDVRQAGPGAELVDELDLEPMEAPPGRVVGSIDAVQLGDVCHVRISYPCPPVAP